MIVTFYNEMGIDDYEGKHQGYFEIEKMFKDKAKHTHKTREHLCTLSTHSYIYIYI